MFDPAYATAIGSIESGGQSDPYTTMGPWTKGDRAHGKYQIMGANIGPWSKEILGQEVTPEQFLASPQIQDAIFQGKFGQYVAKYGPEGAARAWFAGEKGMNNPDAKDVLGTTVSGYGAKFMRALGAPVQPVNASPQPAGSPPVPASFQGVSGYGSPPNNAPAGISGAQFDPGQQLAALGAPQQPIMYAPRRPPDLTQLRALLQAPASPGFRFLRG